MSKILIVDDEAAIVGFLRNYFIDEGYEVLIAHSGKEALIQSKNNPDIILLDISMPDLDGLQVCKQLRHTVLCPILFLTARIDDTEKIEGFGAGADDYIVKPFNIDVLGARVASHLRREMRTTEPKTIKKLNGITIDYYGQTLYMNNKEVFLSKKEFAIVALLTQNIGQVFERERIYELIWGYDAEGDSASVTEHIKRIRSKILLDGKSPIKTVWGVGYKWTK